MYNNPLETTEVFRGIKLLKFNECWHSAIIYLSRGTVQPKPKERKKKVTKKKRTSDKFYTKLKALPLPKFKISMEKRKI